MKLRGLKEEFFTWNRDVFGNLDIKKVVLEEMRLLDMKEETDVLSLEDQTKKEEWKFEMEKLVQLEEVNWLQKSRALWLKEGDNNTWFIYWLASPHRWANCHWKLWNQGGNIFYGKGGEAVVGFNKTLCLFD